MRYQVHEQKNKKVWKSTVFCKKWSYYGTKYGIYYQTIFAVPRESMCWQQLYRSKTTKTTTKTIVHECVKRVVGTRWLWQRDLKRDLCTEYQIRWLRMRAVVRETGSKGCLAVIGWIQFCCIWTRRQSEVMWISQVVLLMSETVWTWVKHKSHL